MNDSPYTNTYTNEPVEEDQVWKCARGEHQAGGFKRMWLRFQNAAGDDDETSSPFTVCPQCGCLFLLTTGPQRPYPDDDP